MSAPNPKPAPFCQAVPRRRVVSLTAELLCGVPVVNFLTTEGETYTWSGERFASMVWHPSYDAEPGDVDIWPEFGEPFRVSPAVWVGFEESRDAIRAQSFEELRAAVAFEIVGEAG